MFPQEREKETDRQRERVKERKSKREIWHSHKSKVEGKRECASNSVIRMFSSTSAPIPSWLFLPPSIYSQRGLEGHKHLCSSPILSGTGAPGTCFTWEAPMCHIGYDQGTNTGQLCNILFRSCMADTCMHTETTTITLNPEMHNRYMFKTRQTSVITVCQQGKRITIGHLLHISITFSSCEQINMARVALVYYYYYYYYYLLQFLLLLSLLLSQL